MRALLFTSRITIPFGEKVIKDAVFTATRWERAELWILRAAAILMGLAIPLLVIGRGAASILLPVIGGMGAILLLSGWSSLRHQLWRGGALGWAVAAMLTVLLVSAFGSIKPGYSLTI